MRHALSPAGRHQRGFSLIELGLALIISGLIGLLVWRWVASAEAPAERAEMQRQLNEAQAAVEGFVLANYRLPCPAADTNGNEACSTSSAVYLPWRTLGVDSQLGRLHYGVNRGGGADLASTPVASVSPDFGLDYTGIPKTSPDDIATATDAAADAANVKTLMATTVGRRTAVNGLDWCRVVRRLGSNPAVAGVLSAGSLSNNLPVATILVHPGANGEFDGNNRVGANPAFRYDLPGRNQDQSYDDLSLATGAADLGSRLGCSAKLSAMQVAAQGAFAQYDNVRFWQEYWSLRIYDVETMKSELEGAETGVIMAAANLAITTAAQVVSIASAANTEGLTAAGIALAAINVGLAIADTVSAAADLKDAQAALADSQAKLTAANTYAAKVYEDFADAMSLALALDQKGLNP